MFVTGTTVGYGDTFPSTTWGRIIAAFSALVGLILTSLLTASLGNSLTFTPEEHTGAVCDLPVHVMHMQCRFLTRLCCRQR
eukprot:3429500-Rhodomonas_salina.5